MRAPMRSPKIRTTPKQNLISPPTGRRVLIPVLLLTQQQVLAQLLCQHLARTRRFKLIGVAGDCPEALQLCQRRQPTILAIDMLVAAPELRALIKELHSRSPRIRIVQFNAALNQTAIQKALQWGVTGYLGPDAAIVELMRTFEAVHAGRLS